MFDLKNIYTRHYFPEGCEHRCPGPFEGQFTSLMGVGEFKAQLHEQGQKQSYDLISYVYLKT